MSAISVPTDSTDSSKTLRIDCYLRECAISWEHNPQLHQNFLDAFSNKYEDKIDKQSQYRIGLFCDLLKQQAYGLVSKEEHDSQVVSSSLGSSYSKEQVSLEFSNVSVGNEDSEEEEHEDVDERHAYDVEDQDTESGDAAKVDADFSEQSDWDYGELDLSELKRVEEDYDDDLFAEESSSVDNHYHTESDALENSKTFAETFFLAFAEWDKDSSKVAIETLFIADAITKEEKDNLFNMITTIIAQIAKLQLANSSRSLFKPGILKPKVSPLVSSMRADSRGLTGFILGGGKEEKSPLVTHTYDLRKKQDSSKEATLPIMPTVSPISTSEAITRSAKARRKRTETRSRTESYMSVEDEDTEEFHESTTQAASSSSSRKKTTTYQPDF